MFVTIWEEQISCKRRGFMRQVVIQVWCCLSFSTWNALETCMSMLILSKVFASPDEARGDESDG